MFGASYFNKEYFSGEYFPPNSLVVIITKKKGEEHLNISGMMIGPNEKFSREQILQDDEEILAILVATIQAGII